MLILTRKRNESIIIGENIEIVVADIEDGKVKLGIKAPKDIEIYRKEVFEAIQNENKEAITIDNMDLSSLKKLFKKQ